jgi:SAM-dependent methyltransferase
MSAEKPEQPTAEAYERGRALLREGRVEEGIDALQRILPVMPKARADIIWAYRARGENERALEHLKRYVEQFTDDAQAWTVMAQIAREQNAPEPAGEYARRALALKPNDAPLCFELGEIFLYAMDYGSAVRAYRRCVALDPQFGRARVRCDLARRLGRIGPVYAITRSAPMRLLGTLLLRSGLPSELVELDMGITLDDRRWEMPLDWGAPADMAPPAPPGQAPEEFERHFADCRCAFWQWFRSLGLEGSLRRTLEVGAGPGHVAEHFQRGGHDVFSITPGEFARRDRERRGLRAVRADFHLTNEPGGRYDLIVADYALHASRAPLFAAWEWRRLLRPDGCLFVMAHLPLDRPAPNTPEAASRFGVPASEVSAFGVHASACKDTLKCELQTGPRFAFGEPGRIMLLTYWQLRWMLRQSGLNLVAETLHDRETDRLESVEYVDGRRRSAESPRAWDVFMVLRKPGPLPFDAALEKPRPPAVKVRNPRSA